MEQTANPSAQKAKEPVDRISTGTLGYAIAEVNHRIEIMAKDEEIYTNLAMPDAKWTFKTLYDLFFSKVREIALNRDWPIDIELGRSMGAGIEGVVMASAKTKNPVTSLFAPSSIRQKFTLFSCDRKRRKITIPASYSRTGEDIKADAMCVYKLNLLPAFKDNRAWNMTPDEFVDEIERSLLRFVRENNVDKAADTMSVAIESLGEEKVKSILEAAEKLKTNTLLCTTTASSEQETASDSWEYSLLNPDKLKQVITAGRAANSKMFKRRGG